MLAAFWWGAGAAAALLVGAAVSYLLRPGPRTVAVVMALGSGLLLGSVAYDLVDESRASLTTWQSGLALLFGAGVFVAGAKLIERRGGGGRKHPGGPRDADAPEAIALGSVLDGVPESFVLGLSVVQGRVSAPLLVGIALSNLPEGMASSSGLRQAGWPARRVFLMWTVVVLASGLAAGVGAVVLSASGDVTTGLVRTFAAGALLAMLADTMLPEAYDVERSWTGALVVAGFAAAVALGAL